MTARRAAFHLEVLDDDEFTFRRHRAFAVNPHSVAVIFVAGDAVVASVPEAFCLRAECGGETAGDQFATGLRPANGNIVAVQVPIEVTFRLY